MKLLTIILLPVFLFSQVIAQNFKHQNEDAEKFIRATIDSLKLPGVAIGVVKNGEILKLSTYGKANLDWQVDVTPHTNFQTASVSKLLLTTLMLKSINNNKLSLDDEVSKFIDNVPLSWKGMRISHLLTHTSGIKMFKQGKGASIETVIAALKDSTLAFPYGTGQLYASGDFSILLYMFQRIYNKPYSDIIRDEITVPLGMTDGAFDKERTVSDWIETDIVPQKATTYYVKNNTVTPYKFMYPSYSYAAGGYFASITDLVNWAVGMDRGSLFPKMLEMNYAYSPVIVNGKPSGFSKIGWNIGTVNGIKFGGHSGGPGLADLQRFPQSGITVIVLTNDGEMLPYFANAIATFYIDKLGFKRSVNKFKRTVALQ